MDSMVDFLYIWELVNELFSKYEVTNLDEALDNDKLRVELETLEEDFWEMLNAEENGWFIHGCYCY